MTEVEAVLRERVAKQVVVLRALKDAMKVAKELVAVRVGDAVAVWGAQKEQR